MLKTSMPSRLADSAAGKNRPARRNRLELMEGVAEGPVGNSSRKICTRCSLEKSLDDFTARRKVKSGKNSWCRSCNVAYNLAYREKNREYCRECGRNNYYKNGHKWKKPIRSPGKPDKFKDAMRARLRYAISVDKLSKPKKCEMCGTESPLMGHHHDYKFPLEIIFLCSLCHGFVHRKALRGEEAKK